MNEKKKLWNFFLKFVLNIFFSKRGRAPQGLFWGHRGGRNFGRGGPPLHFELGTSLYVRAHQAINEDFYLSSTIFVADI